MADRPDKFLTDQVVAGGLDRAEAEDAVTRVLAAIAEQLRAGRYVVLPGVGKLVSQERPTWVPGHRGRRAYLRRSVLLKNPAVLSRGEPYEVTQ